ncbi:vgr related protein [Novosphingobium profundi]|uniref:vgr related protein n=1 Tax=Novosphingobium profundi TaxID=1774954 RepID=UPI001BD9C39D|nr:vgr related protein [Novosphingobium profundi]MBT0668981.1 vgr related protein [Novosphingobium profundi]
MEHTCPPGEERGLTAAEIALARRVFGDAIAYTPVRIRRRRWFPWQPLRTVMAPCGHIHFHPRAQFYCDDFAASGMDLQGLFIHEMTHVWQAQRKGWHFLPTHRHPWCRYEYTLEPGKPFERYGLEQQAEIVRHAFMLLSGVSVEGLAPLSVYLELLPFTPQLRSAT